jgi:hypothetical protein
MVMDADLSAAEAGEVFLSVIGASAVKAVGFVVIDSLHFESFMQAIPRRGFISMYNGTFSNSRTDESGGLAFHPEYGRDGIAASFADDDDDLTFPILIASVAAVATVFLLICWFYVSPEVAAIDLSRLTLTADNAALHFLCQRFT